MCVCVCVCAGFFKKAFIAKTVNKKPTFNDADAVNYRRVVLPLDEMRSSDRPHSKPSLAKEQLATPVVEIERSELVSRRTSNTGTTGYAGPNRGHRLAAEETQLVRIERRQCDQRCRRWSGRSGRGRRSLGVTGWDTAYLITDRVYVGWSVEQGSVLCKVINISRIVVIQWRDYRNWWNQRYSTKMRPSIRSSDLILSKMRPIISPSDMILFLF